MLRFSAEEMILTILPGMLADVQARRSVMILQTYIDDSGSDPGSEQFVLAGYVADGEAWKRFHEDWGRVLDQEPALGYFKMVEAAGMRGQFQPDRGWTRALVDARLVSLTEVIKRHCSMQISTHILAADYNATLRKIPYISGSNNIVHRSPYNIMVHRLMTEFFFLRIERGITAPCNWIFDMQGGHMDFALQAWESARRIVEAGMPHLSRAFGSPPAFHNDKDVLPLQAADLLAWANRRVLTRNTVDGKLPPAALDNLLSVPAINFPWTREGLEREQQKAILAMAKYGAMPI